MSRCIKSEDDNIADAPEPENEVSSGYSLMYDMICQDSIVAVSPNVESLSDYFLFHVTSEGVTCLKDNITYLCKGN